MDMRVNPKANDLPEPTIGELLRGLLLDLGQLVRTEIKLAQTEVSQNVKQAQAPMVLMAVGILFLFGSFLALLGAFVGWLAPLVGAGWAALIVALVVGGAGTMLLMSGQKQLKGIGFVPTRSVRSIKRDVETLKGHDL